MRTRLTLMLKFLVSMVLAAIPTTGASAGDFADREIIGFSQDGSMFAFEEYGVSLLEASFPAYRRNLVELGRRQLREKNKLLERLRIQTGHGR